MSEKPVWAIFLMVLLFAVPKSVAFEPPPERDIFTVAILGDRTGAWPDGLKVIERAVFEINQLNPDFVIHIGDMVQGYTRDEDQWLREYEEFMSYMDELNVAWCPTAGNHDVFTAIGDPNDRTYEDLYKKHFGPLYYSFDYRNSHFIIMYTDEAMASKPIISSDQIAWLKKDLEENDKTNVFVFMHKPLWDSASYPDSNWGEVHEIIKGFPVRAVIAGHFHSYQKDLSRDGIQYYFMGVTGGMAFISEHELTGWFNHYNILRVEDDKFTMAVVKLGNVEADDYVLTKDQNKMWTLSALSAEKTGVRGWLAQPTAAAVEGEIELYAHNPLDVDIPVEVRLNPERALWAIEPPSLNFTLRPESDVNAKVILSSPKADSKDIVPPEFEFEYKYTDSRGREVPVVVRRRVFLRGTHEVHKCEEPVRIDCVNDESFWKDVQPIYNHTWIYSIYDRPDAPPKMYLAADDANLYFFAEVMDDKYSYLKDKQPGRILSDCIIFSTLPSGERQEVVIFPFNEDGNGFVGVVDERGILRPANMSAIPGVEYRSRTDDQEGYYYCEGKVPLSLLFGDEPVAGKEVPFNVGVLDNDLEAFVYIRSWAFDRDPQSWGILKFAGK